MARNLKAQCAKCRREGEKLFLKGERCYTTKCAITRRNYPAGMHGPKGKPRLTGYGAQLREKQKAKHIYGVLEKQFKNYFFKAKKLKGDTSEYLFGLLEMRLDNVIYRLGFAKSRKQARQMVGHGLFSVNGKNINIPSYQVKVGDVVSIKPSAVSRKIFQNLPQTLQKQEVATWLSLDPAKMEGKVVRRPAKDDVRAQFDLRVVVEFYSR